jgi:hypothetical protein
VFDCLPLGTIIILHLDKLVLILEKVDVLAQWATAIAAMIVCLDGTQSQVDMKELSRICVAVI